MYVYIVPVAQLKLHSKIFEEHCSCFAECWVPCIWFEIDFCVILLLPAVLLQALGSMPPPVHSR